MLSPLLCTEHSVDHHASTFIAKKAAATDLRFFIFYGQATYA
jgi:hypothetical protein